MPFIIPLLFIVLGATLLVALIDAIKDDPELSEIDDKNIYESYLIKQDEEQLSEKVIKQKCTRAINTIITHYEGFKIGKSGNPKGRNQSETYKKYSEMYVLCVSENKDLIKGLESYYNNKYINNRKNDNKRKGSAGVTTDANGRHYLYIAVRK